MSTLSQHSQLIDADLKRLGFEVVEPTIRYKFSISSAAKEKEGKTTWAFTAPGPIGAISTDTGTEFIAKQFLSEKPIIINYFKSADELQNEGNNTKAKQDMYEREWARMKDSILAMVRSKRIRTLIVDTATEAWELCRLAEFGKLTQVMPHNYTTVNSEFKALIKAADENQQLNSIWIHKKKKEYKASGASGKENWTGKWERSGFGDMPFLVDLNMEHFFQPPGAVVPDGAGGNVQLEEGRFGVRVIDSRINMLSVVGQEFTGETANFRELAYSLFPETYGTDVWETK